MPRANWGVKARDIEKYDRSSQYQPYTGAIPPNGVYAWEVRKAQYVAAAREKLPQLRLSLALKSRNTSDRAFAGYHLMLFLPIADNTQFRYVPFLDAIGVSGSDFESRTIVNQDGVIAKIGPWKADSGTLILGDLRDDPGRDGQMRKTLGWIGEYIDSTTDDDDDDDDDYDDDDYDDDYDDDDDGDDTW